MALQQFVAWLLGRVNNCRAGNPITCNHHWTRHQLTNTLYHSKGLDQRSGSNPLERSGSEVWIGGLDRVWERGLIQTLHFEPQPYIYIYIIRISYHIIICHLLSFNLHGLCLTFVYLMCQILSVLFLHYPTA